MSALKKLHALLSASDYVPVTASDLADQLHIPARARRAFENELRKLLSSGSLVRIKGDRLALPRDADLVTGQIFFKQNGNAYLIPEPSDSETKLPDIQVFSEDAGVALHKDRVVVRLLAPRRGGRSNRKSATGEETVNGRVHTILERARDTVTGTLKKAKTYWFVIPDDPRFNRDVIVSDPSQNKALPVCPVDSKVVVKLDDWTDPHQPPEGDIIEVLGKSFEPLVEQEALLRQFALANDFPPAVLAEVAKYSPIVSDEQRAGRMDCRDLLIFTVDPQDAKDFDDALSLEHLEGGRTRVGVHIADVTAYVAPRSALDEEAGKRGNSTYLVGQVIPMLPHALSNGLCSLVEAQDRLCKCAFLTYDADARLVETSYANTVIRSRKRLTYEQALHLLRDDNLDNIRALPLPPAHQTGSTGRALSSLSDSELRELQNALRHFWSIAKVLRARRFESGALDLEIPEVRIYCDVNGYPDRIVKESGDESHWFIEEFMLAANEAVARVLFEAKLPALARVHEAPLEPKLNAFCDFAEQFGITPGDLTVRKHVNALLDRIREHPQAYVLRMEFLKSMQKACYKPEPLGHYGLNKKHYLHFTSPIRRYADLVCHRVLDNYLVRNNLPTAPKAGRLENYSLSRLSAIGRHISATEAESAQAERESRRNKLLEFFERQAAAKVKQRFPAIITDIKNHGLFLELPDHTVFGYLPASSLTDDLYILAGDGLSLTGRKNKRVLALGDRIEVEAFRVDRFKRQFDFVLAPSPKG